MPPVVFDPYTLMNAGTGIVAHFQDLLGNDAVVSGDATLSYSIDGRRPQCVVCPATIDELCRVVGAADGLAVIPAGNGSRLNAGRAPRGYDVAVSTQRLRRVLAHEPADMTVTVEAGLTLAELNATLGRAGQRLPLDPPQPERTTIGAVIATDACGPLRLSQGKVRDLLIGISVVLADGTLIKGGGRVVKNVAGYDLMKLFTGSFGTLGVVAEATFKVRPCPEREAVFIVPTTTTSDAVALALSALSGPLAPQYIEVLNGAGGARAGIAGPALVVGCGGSAEEIDVQRQRLAELTGADVRQCDELAAARRYAAVRDFPTLQPRAVAGRQVENTGGAKVSVLPSKLGDLLQRVDEEAAQHGLEAAICSHAGNGVASVRFHHNAGDSEAFAGFAEWLRAVVRRDGGWVVFDALPAPLKERIDPWGDDIPGLELMRSIKQTLDPRNRLSPGRFVGGI